MAAPRNDRSGIVRTALALLDELGLADLSMRRLAAALEVQPSALYWHFESKQALLAAVAVEIVAAMRPAHADLADAALDLREALLAHRDGAEVVLSSYALSLGSGGAEQRIRAVVPDDDTAAVVLQFVLGHSQMVQQRLQAAAFGVVTGDPAEIGAQTLREFQRALDLFSGS